MSSTISPLKSYAVEMDQRDEINAIPRSMLPARIARPVQATKNIQNITPISGSSITSGGQTTIQLPFGAGAGYMKAGSAYLRFRYSATQASDEHGFAGIFGRFEPKNPKAVVGLLLIIFISSQDFIFQFIFYFKQFSC